jgi:hypothetical protein
LRAAAEGLAGLGADLRGVDGGGEGFDSAGRRRIRGFSAEGSGLDGDEAGAAAGGAIVAVEAALHELAGEDGAVGDVDYVADEDLAEARGEGGGVVADLVGVREYYVRGVSDWMSCCRAPVKPSGCIGRAADARRG